MTERFWSTPFHLAPLAGVSDLSFRRVVAQYHPGLVTTEMVSINAMAYHDRKMAKMTMTHRGEGPVAIQIFGNDPEKIARVVEEQINPREDLVSVDFNMGCPAPKIVNNWEGSRLMTDPQRVTKIAEALVKASSKPVSFKFRLGYTASSQNYLEIAKRLEVAGVDYITLHARTRDQFYEGEADWEAIRLLKAHVSIPVIGNGDVFSPEDAVRMMTETGCDGVAIGRGAMGNPFLFKQIDDYIKTGSYERPTLFEVIDTIKLHYAMAIEEKGESVAIREMRKHIAWYLKGFRGAKPVKDEINRMDDAQRVYKRLDEYLNDQLT